MEKGVLQAESRGAWRARVSVLSWRAVRICRGPRAHRPLPTHIASAIEPNAARLSRSCCYKPFGKTVRVGPTLNPCCRQPSPVRPFALPAPQPPPPHGHNRRSAFIATSTPLHTPTPHCSSRLQTLLDDFVTEQAAAFLVLLRAKVCVIVCVCVGGGGVNVEPIP